jgi:polar amino acid transport system substrate-binding protein
LRHTTRLLTLVAAVGIIASACGSSSKAATTTAGQTSTTGLVTTTVAETSGTIGKCAVKGVVAATPLKTVTADTLTVQTSLPAPGWFNGDTEAAIQDGYEYCMAANIAWRAGLHKVVVKNVDFSALVAAQTKDFDLALAEISITDKRKQVVDFSVPYFGSDIGVLVNKGTAVATTADLQKLKIGIQESTTGGDFVMAKIKKDAQVFPDSASMFAALQSGTINAAMTDTSIVLAQAGTSNGALSVVAQYKTGESYGALYPKGASNNPEFDKIIQTLIDDKTLDGLATTYLTPAFGGDPTKVPYLSA